MPLNLHKLLEPVTVGETFTVKVYAVMNEPVVVGESFLQRAKAAVFYRLSGRVPRRFGGLFPGRGG